MNLVGKDRAQVRDSPTMNKSTVFVIAGPNGAGKTTFASEFLPEFVHCREFLNADLIAAGLSPFAPESENIRAGRLMLTRMKELMKVGKDFGLETTLSGRSYVRLFSEMKSLGYHIALFFHWLPSDQLAVTRVANRVRQGGHNVSEADIRRRFVVGWQNLFTIYRPLLDSWWLYDASCLPPQLVASFGRGDADIRNPVLYQQIVLAPNQRN